MKCLFHRTYIEFDQVFYSLGFKVQIVILLGDSKNFENVILSRKISGIE